MRPSSRLAFGLIAFVLLGLALWPWSAWIGPVPVPVRVGTSGPGSPVPVQIAWTVGLLAAGGVLVLALKGRIARALDARFERLRSSPHLPFAAVLGLAAFGASAVLAVLLFDRNPHHVDSIAQLFHGRILARGHLTAPAPELYEFFGATNLVRHQGRWLSQYPPGHALLLAAGWWGRAPWLINPLLTGVTVVLLYLTGRRLFGGSAARLAALLVLISPFVLFMGASQMNHTSLALALTFALYALVRARDADPVSGGAEGADAPPGAARDQRVWVMAAGVTLGLAAAIRPLEAAAWAAVLIGWCLVRRRAALGLILAGGCAVAVLPLLAYNASTTGAPFRFGYTLLWGEGHGLGFHGSPWGDPFGPLSALGNTALDLRMLNQRLFAWPFPGILFPVLAPLGLAGGWLDLTGREREAIGVLLALFLVVPLAYFAYWHRDTYLGPRFLYAGLAPILLLSAIGLVTLDRRLGRWRTGLRLALLAGAVVALSRGLPMRAGELAGGYPEMKLHPGRAIGRAGLEAPLVLVKVGWGNRLIARLWGWGIDASETERSFRTVDGCRLQLALDRADSLAAAEADSALARSGLRRQLEVWRRADLPVVRGRLPDASVRVDTTRALADRCVDEIRRDVSGFTVYGPLVWRNDPWLERGPVYARDLGPERNRRLIARYPDRPLYRYAPPGPEAPPVLRPVRRPERAGSDEAARPRPDAAVDPAERRTVGENRLAHFNADIPTIEHFFRDAVEGKLAPGVGGRW